MLSKIDFENFKCFNEESLELRNVTVLAGANASGKSSVIQALLLWNYTNEFIERYGGKAGDKSIDIDDVFDIQIGAPRALVSQNPVDQEEGDFSLCVWKDDADVPIKFIYDINKLYPLDLKIAKNAVTSKANMQYLNAERIGPRTMHSAKTRESIGTNGDNAPYLIEIADKTMRKISPTLCDLSDVSDKFSYHVEKWMSAILGALQIDIHTDYNKAITEMKIKNSLTDTAIVPTLTGFGISYVLPIVVAGLWASGDKDSVLLVENPEAHLHPAAQSNIGKFLALLADSGVQVIIETHSEHVIDGIRYQLACIGQTQKAIIHFMENQGTFIGVDTIHLSENGELTMWPKGFFDQKQHDLRDLLILRRKNAQR